MTLYTMVYTTYCFITIVRHASGRTCEINEEQRTSKTTIEITNDIKFCNQAFISRAKYLTFTLKTKKVR